MNKYILHKISLQIFNKRDLRSFLACSNNYRSFIQDNSGIREDLYDLFGEYSWIYCSRSGNLYGINKLCASHYEDVPHLGSLDWPASYGHLHIVKWLHNTCSEVYATTDAMDFAANEGHFEMVKWLHNNRSEGCTDEAMEGADRFGYSDIFKWLSDNKGMLYIYNI